MVDINTQKPGPIVVVEGTVFVATIGATVAAATGVTGLKIGFCWEQISITLLYIMAWNDSVAHGSQQYVLTCVMVCVGCGF